MNGSTPAAQSLTNMIHTSMKEFVCPSNGNPLYQQPQSSPPQFAFTNYKAMGASCKSSLAFCTNSSGSPPYGTAAVHPDGAIFPSGNNLPISRILDGLSHTIIIMETIDDTFSVWMIGSQRTLTGLPVPMLRKAIRAHGIAANKINGWWMVPRGQLLRLRPPATACSSSKSPCETGRAVCK